MAVAARSHHKATNGTTPRFMLRPTLAPEHVLHTAALKLLRMALPSDAVVFHVPLGGLRTPQSGALMKRLGAMPGLPDLLIVYAGLTFGIELKTIVGRRSANQIVCHEALRRAGVGVATCTSVEQVVAALDAWNIPCRIRVSA